MIVVVVGDALRVKPRSPHDPRSLYQARSRNQTAFKLRYLLK
jgi:hypothetical protein